MISWIARKWSSNKKSIAVGYVTPDFRDLFVQYCNQSSKIYRHRSQNAAIEHR